MHGAVHRLHGGMRQERQFVGASNRSPCAQSPWRHRRRILATAPSCSLAARRSVPDRSAELTSAFGPSSQVIVERLQPLLGRPHVIADHRHQVVEHDDLAHAGTALAAAVVDVRDLAAEHRAGRERRELHARQHGVDAVDRLAVDLVGRVEALQRLADQLEILRILQRRILRRRDSAAARVDQRAVAERAAACGMRDLAVRRRAACRVDLPLLRGRLHQHGARRGAGLAQRRPERADGIGIAGDLDAEDRIAIELVVRRRVLQLDLLKSASSSSARIMAIEV